MGAAHELHRHIIAGTARSNLTVAVSDTLSKLDDFIRIATKCADNKICVANGFVDRSDFLRELQLSLSTLHGW